MTFKADCTLYGTSHCHLCEQAEQQVVLALGQLEQVANWTVVIESLDIMDYSQRLDAWRDKIPLLHHEGSDSSLFWPFDAQQVFDFLLSRRAK